MRASSVTMLVASLLGGPASAETHPFSVHDMLAMERISDPRVSPDGSSVVFTVRSTDLEANKGRNDLWLPSTGGTGARRLPTHEARGRPARWAPGGRSLFSRPTRQGPPPG